MSQFFAKWPKYWSFSFSISPSSEYSGLISFRMDQVDLLAVQGTLKSLLQHHNLKASILWCSAFSMVWFSHPYMTAGKTIALTIVDLQCCVSFQCIAHRWFSYTYIHIFFKKLFSRNRAKGNYIQYLGVGFPGGSVVKNLPANARDMDSILDLGGSHMKWSN